MLWEKTPDAVGITELARHMGIGRQSFYDTYGSKEQLFLEALTRYYEREVAGLRSILRREGSAMQNISDVIAALGKRSKERGRKGCLVASTMVEHGPLGDEAAVLCRRTVQAIDSAFLQTFERAREQGELPDEVRPDDMSALMVSTMFGMANLARLGLAEALMPRVGRALRSQLALTARGTPGKPQ